YIIHRYFGLVILGLICIHPVLVQLADDMLFIPFQLRYWPEFTGLFLAFLLLGMVLGALWRIPLGLPYHWWWRLHRVTAVVVPVVLFIHVLNVSETFEDGFPRQATFAVAGLYFVLYAWVKTRSWRIRSHPYIITAVESAGEEAHSINIKPQIKENSKNDAPGTPHYFPGQFAFVTLQSDNISSEEHPFTIASSPSRPGTLQFIIRNSGDWTSHIPEVQPGDHLFLDGPYGLFTHLRCASSREIIMIAGGIGITPMLSMLRYMADTKDSRRVTLLWSNKTQKHVIYPKEMDTLQSSLPGLQLVHIFTAQGAKKRLDQARLAQLLSGCSLESAIFVCGPPQMMTSIHTFLQGMGYPRRQIFMERFNL
ncbi:MAG: hypothetical protein KGY41_08505, partial [Desulfovermiculus sp.]|nr:hypothetical protein [Desulfovermiculus sp.]